MAEDTTNTPPTDEKPAETVEQAAPVAVPKKKKAKRTVASGQIHVLATFNNTIITITDEKGNVLSTSSAGAAGFRGSKKGTAYAAQMAAEKAISDAKQNYGLTKADVFVKGIGLGRESAVRSVINQRMQIESIRDVTGIPHGGVRPRRAKRN